MTTILNDFVAVCAVGAVESVACAVKANVPAVVGVPVSAPVEEFRLTPGGSDPELMVHVYCPLPPLAAGEELYAR